MDGQLLLDAAQRLQRYPIAFPQFRRAVGAVQHEHGLAIRCNDMDMGGPVIVPGDHHAQAIEAKNGWQ